MTRVASAALPKSGFDARQLTDRLGEGLRAMGLATTEEQRTALIAFLSLLGKWNGVFNLTSVREPADMLAVHLLDALSIVALVDEYQPTSVLDVGSGAGIPSIPLAVVRPKLIVHSVDAVAKKIGFQLQAKAELRLLNFHPLHARVESVTLPAKPSMIVSRAFADLPTMLGSITHLVDGATTVLAMKGQIPVNDLAVLPSDWKVATVTQLDVPFLGAERCAVILRRAN